MARVQRAWLNDVEFTDAHPALMLQHINEPDPKVTYKTAAKPYGGLVELSRSVERREIILEFAIREGLDFTRRQEAYEKAIAWAWNGGWLKLSDHPGQQIYVTLSSAPALGRLREWTEDIALTFTAAWYPYWQDIVEQTAAHVNAASHDALPLTVFGNMPSCISCDITPVSGSLSEVELAIDGTYMHINITDANYYVPVGTALTLGYDFRHLLYIRKGTTSLMQFRSGADDLIAQPGLRTVAYNCHGVSCNVVFRSKGVWL